jgi:hypothetical protein
VLCWDGAKKKIVSGEEPVPMEVDVEIPFWTTGGTFFRYKDLTVQGIHVRFDRVGEHAVGLLELFEDDEVKSLPLDQFCVEAE